jgi:hypothetical protein
MIALILWCVFAASVLFVSLLVHISTFVGIDPMEAFPGVMSIHVLIFPPFVAALIYASKVGGPRDHQVVGLQAQGNCRSPDVGVPCEPDGLVSRCTTSRGFCDGRHGRLALRHPLPAP